MAGPPVQKDWEKSSESEFAPDDTMQGPLSQVDWERLLSPDSQVPPDVIFLVKGENGKCSKIGAHRLLLACICPVFKSMAYGPLKETKEEIEVMAETSPEGFCVMIEYIYAGDPWQVLYKVNSPKTICELYALGDYYDIVDLTKMILDLLPSLAAFEITRESLINVATVGKRYSEHFVDLGAELLMQCLKFYLDSTDKNFPGDTDHILPELMEFGRSALQLSGN